MDDGAHVPCPLRSAARRSPDAPAIVGVGGSLAYGELDQRVSVAAAKVRELGYGAGDRVALYLPKDERYLVLLLALIRTGCVACLLSTRLPPRGAAPLPERTACRALISTSEEILEGPGVRTLRPEDLLSEATVVLPEPDVPLGEAVAGATHVSLVSTQLLRLLREGGFEAGRLEAILLGGGPLPTSLVDEAADLGLPVHTSYGLTEMASQVTTTPPGASRKELHTSGRPLPHREVGISGDGEILVRGETLFAGYVEGDADGWFHTGDIGDLSENGYLRVLGRKDNLFVSGGENIHPEEIEEALSSLAGVEVAVVVPFPDPEFGARPVAFVRMADGVVESETLARALEKVLPRFKIPVVFHNWPEEAGFGEMKVDRAFFHERAIQSRRGVGG